MSYVPFGKFVLLPRLCLLLAERITMDFFKCVMGRTGVSTVSRSYPHLPLLTIVQKSGTELTS
jgi:hypothetical protein